MYKPVILFKIQYILNFSLKSREYCLCDAIMTHKLNFHSTYFFSIIFILRTVHLPENNSLKLFCISWLFFLKYSIFWIFHWNPGNIVFAMLSWLINLISIPHIFFHNIYTKDRPFTWKLFTKIILYKLVILFKIQYILNFSLKSREYCLCDAIMTHKLNFHSTYFFSIIFILRTVHLPENNLLKLFCISRLFFLKYSIFWIFHWNPGNIVFAMLSWLIHLISLPHIFFP